jgi:hypothetical protein
MKTSSLGSFLTIAAIASATAAPPYQDRFVWVFGWGLGSEGHVQEISKLLDTASASKLNGAVVSFGLDSLCQQSPDFLRRLQEVKKRSDQDGLELIPAIFSVGYGGALAHDRNLAEGLPVEDAPFVAQGEEARFAGETKPTLLNGDFEDHTGNKLKNFGFHDQPGEISFVDEAVRHAGKASLRLENFTANPHGHGRIMQEIKVIPNRCYRMTLWAKTDGLAPSGAFRATILVGDRELAPRQFNIPATSDWRRVSFIFNSLTYDKVRAYAGLWGGKGGKLWLDDWTVEEVGPVNPLARPGTPTTVKSEDGTITYEAGKDYAPLADPVLRLWSDDKPAIALKLLPGGRIKDGQKLRVGWYHSMIINDSQVGVCMAEPALYEIYDHEAKLLAEQLHPRKVLLNMDEVRMGGTCRACKGRNMAELLGQCITRQVQALKKYNPGVQVYIWSDMLDPNHNAHGNYYLVEGDYTGSWNHVPRDLVIAVWGGEPREKSLKFFADQGFQTLAACYYDADNLNDVKGWLALAKDTKGVRGFMYTPWEKKYGLLPEFGKLLQ